MNSITGGEQYFDGYPKYSPNKKRLITSYYDIEVGFYSNGFTLHEINDNTYKMLFNFYNQDIEASWGPEGMIWKDDDTLYFIRIAINIKDNSRILRFFQSVRFETID